MEPLFIHLPEVSRLDIPETIPDPFSVSDHPTAHYDVIILKKYILLYDDWNHHFFSDGGGKMFGVLVAKSLPARSGGIGCIRVHNLKIIKKN